MQLEIQACCIARGTLARGIHHVELAKPGNRPHVCASRACRRGGLADRQVVFSIRRGSRRHVSRRIRGLRRAVVSLRKDEACERFVKRLPTFQRSRGPDAGLFHIYATFDLYSRVLSPMRLLYLRLRCHCMEAMAGF